MRAKALVFVGFVSLAACSGAEDAAEYRQEDIDKAVAEVEAAQTPPPDVVTPQRITAEDRKQFNFSPSGCDFAVDSPERGAIAILQLNVGYMQFDGAIERFAPDAGGGEGPLGTSEHYDSGRHSLAIDYLDRNGTVTGSENTDYRARITLKDGRDRTVYLAEGTASCGS